MSGDEAPRGSSSPEGAYRDQEPGDLPVEFETASRPRSVTRGVRIFTWTVLALVAVAVVALTVAMLSVAGG